MALARQSRSLTRDTIHDEKLLRGHLPKAATDSAAARSLRRAAQDGGGPGRMLSQSAAFGSFEVSVSDPPGGNESLLMGQSNEYKLASRNVTVGVDRGRAS
jgi:hypothetical protein